MIEQVAAIKDRMKVLDDTTEKLAFIDDFNKRLAVFNTSVTELEGWLSEGRKRIDAIVSPTADLSPEDRVTKTMEVQEDLRKKSEYTKRQENEREEIFPKADERVPSDAKKFNARLENLRKTMDSMDDEVKKECSKFSEDVKFWAEFQTGIKEFEPWIKKAEIRKSKGLAKPITLVDACGCLGDCKVSFCWKYNDVFQLPLLIYRQYLFFIITNFDDATFQNFQDECVAKMKVLEEAEASAKKMSCHNDADAKVTELKVKI